MASVSSDRRAQRLDGGAGVPDFRRFCACPALELLVRHLENSLEHAEVGGFQAAAEPLHALVRGAVRVFLGRGEAGRVPLQAVVADGPGRLDGRIDVAVLEELELLLAVMGPDAGQVVGLEFLRTRILVKQSSDSLRSHQYWKISM